jgi:hypothetical protein
LSQSISGLPVTELLRLVLKRLPETRLLYDLVEQRKGGTKTKEYLNLLLEKPETPDKEAAMMLFNGGLDNKMFIRSRSILRKVFLDALFHFEYQGEQFPIHWQREYELSKAMFQVKVLIKEGARRLAEEILDKILIESEVFHFTNIMVEALQLQKGNYSIYGKVDLLLTATEKLNKLQEIQKNEFELQYITNEVQANLLKSVNNRNKFMPRFKEIIQIVKDIKTRYETPLILNNSFALINMYNYYTDNFNDNLKLCEEMENKYASSQTGRLTIKIKDVIYIKANALLRVGDYTSGIKYVLENQNLFVPESPNWFLLQEDLFSMYVYNYDFNSAQNLLRRLAPWRESTMLTNINREVWLLRIGFLSLVTEYTEHLKYVRHFFTQHVTLTKDTLGYKTQIQIMQIIYYLKEGEIETANQGLNALNRNLYRIKHITSPKRLVLFVRGLLNVIASHKNPKELQRIHQQTLAKFASYPPTNTHFSEMEIIPYEQLWHVCMECLRGSKQYVALRKRKQRAK